VITSKTTVAVILTILIALGYTQWSNNIHSEQVKEKISGMSTSRAVQPIVFTTKVFEQNNRLIVEDRYEQWFIRWEFTTTLNPLKFSAKKGNTILYAWDYLYNANPYDENSLNTRIVSNIAATIQNNLEFDAKKRVTLAKITDVASHTVYIAYKYTDDEPNTKLTMVEMFSAPTEQGARDKRAAGNQIDSRMFLEERFQTVTDGSFTIPPGYQRTITEYYTPYSLQLPDGTVWNTLLLQKVRNVRNNNVLEETEFRYLPDTSLLETITRFDEDVAVNDGWEFVTSEMMEYYTNGVPKEIIEITQPSGTKRVYRIITDAPGEWYGSVENIHLVEINNQPIAPLPMAVRFGLVESIDEFII